MYEITGTAGYYGVAYVDEYDNTLLKGPFGDGWTYTWVQTGKRYIFCTANSYKKEGSVTVNLYKNGKIIATDTQSGEYAIATITGKY